MSGPSVFKTLKLNIDFPFEPYGIQKVMMSTIVRTLINKEHSLIESPTGTGKTLSLLCAALAWQKESQKNRGPFISDRLKKQIQQQKIEKQKKKPCTCGKRSTYNELKEAKENLKSKGTKWVEDDECMLKKRKIDTPEEILGKDETSLLESPHFKKEITETPSNCEQEPEVIIIEKEDDDIITIIDDEEAGKSNGKSNKKFCISCAAIEAEERFSSVLDGESQDSDVAPSKVPRIYYGTRTHKQITQVVRELNKTPYKKNLKICILSARERTCINSDVKDLPNRNDRCQELVQNKKESNNQGRSKRNDLDLCPYYSDSTTIAQVFQEINYDFKEKAWDIEDAAQFGREHSTCPYYGIRSLQEDADITFSPYNYLLDPTIRKALDINLANSIVVFDEAHNIEDICRESASFTIDTRQIEDILETIRIASGQYLQGSAIMDACNYFRNKFSDIMMFLRSYPFDSGEKEHKVMMNQQEMKDSLSNMNLDSTCLQQLRENLKALRGDDDDDKSKESASQQQALTFGQMQFITQLSITLEFMYSHNQKHVNDFRCVITKSLENDYYKFNPRAGNPTQRKQNDDSTDRYICQFSLFCMNSGVAFQKIVEQSWSIIVASGTLSPIESLKSELGCKFSNVFEGKHVIPSERIFASVISRGPMNIDLDCGYKNSMRLEFQDSVGAIVRDVCTTVPNGILCFFPSYDRMENFYQRWVTKGLLGEIRKKKKLFREKKNVTAAAFESELVDYNKHAQGKGALLFAVFRGKCSEGIDFADNAARAVITIGIPYPNVKEVCVDLKRSYNNTARIDRPELMPGSSWYASQGFRALNQALGRCIRHKEDWGAIIMIDSRLSTGLNNVSKWLRSVVLQSQNYDHIKYALQEFVDIRTSQG